MSIDFRSNRTLILKCIFCAGILLTIIGVFLPIVRSSYMDGSFKMGSLYGFGGAVELLELGSDMESSLAFVGIYFFWIPTLSLIAAAALLFKGRNVKISLGLSAATVPSMLILNIIFLGVVAILKEEFDGAWYGSFADLKISVLPMIVSIIGLLMCIASVIILFVQDLRGTAFAVKNIPGGSGVGGGSVPQMSMGTGVLKCVSGSIKGHGVSSDGMVKIGKNATVVIGRGTEGVDIMVDKNDSSVSRRHCGIMYDANTDTYFVTDYSSNGTSLGDGTKLITNVRTAVKKGTVIVLSNKTKIRVC